MPLRSKKTEIEVESTYHFWSWTSRHATCAFSIRFSSGFFLIIWLH